MSDKKHKSGYELLKVRYNEEVREHQALETKYAELEKEHNELTKELDSAHGVIEHYKAECDKWNDKYLQADAERQTAIDRYNSKQTELGDMTQAYRNVLAKMNEQDLRIASLLKHCPFWVRWMYHKKKFKKGE